MTLVCVGPAGQELSKLCYKVLDFNVFVMGNLRAVRLPCVSIKLGLTCFDQLFLLCSEVARAFLEKGINLKKWFNGLVVL